MDSHVWRQYLAFWIMLVCEVVYHVTGNVQSDVFKERVVCGVKQRLDNGCMQLATLSPMSRVNCAALCHQNSTSCLGVVLNDTGNCYFHYDCGVLDTTATCTADDALFTAFQHDELSNVASSCQNGGVWQGVSKTCLCGPYTSGSRCESLPTSCNELREWGFPIGIHTVDMHFLNNSVIAKVKCEIRATTIRTFVSHNNGTSNYNATFQEYKDGFHKGDAAFWLGLDNLHKLTSAGVDDLVIVIVIGGVKVLKTYNGFEIEDASDDYKVEFNGWTVVSNSLGLTIGRCLTSSYEAKFSAWDLDHDREPNINMAAKAGTGWWFDKNDRFCNLNGIKPLDHSDSPNYVSVDRIDMSLNEYGDDFESTTLYLKERIP